MVQILDLITIGEVQQLRVDADPSAGDGVAAPVGSMAYLETGSNEGIAFIKYGVSDTAWDRVLRLQDGSVRFGIEGRIPIYFEDGYKVDDVYGSNNNSVFINATQPTGTRTTPLSITFPDLGTDVNNANVVLSEGTQTLNGTYTFNKNTTFNENVSILGDLSVQGSLTYLSTTNTEIQDALITLNKGGAEESAIETGFEIEEDDQITGFFKTTVNRLGYKFKAPGQAGIANLFMPVANQSYDLPNYSGILLLGDGVNKTGDYAQIGFFNTTNEMESLTGVGTSALTLDTTNFFLGIQQAAPKSILHVGNNTTSGTVAANAIILGVPNATNNVGNGALIANGSGSPNTASGSDSSVFGAGNSATGARSVAFGNNTTTSGINALAGGQDSEAAGANSLAFGRRAKTGNNDGALVLSDNQNADIEVTNPNEAKFRYQNGYTFNKGADFVDPNFQLLQNSATTTNATPTTLQTISLPSNCVALVEARVLGRRTGGTGGSEGDCATYIRTARIISVSGNLTIKDLQSDYTSEDQNGWNGLIDVSGGNVRVRVHGAANNNISWHVTTKLQILA